MSFEFSPDMLISKLKTDLINARSEINKLREENNRFRLVLFSSPLDEEMAEPNAIYLAQKKLHIEAMPIEQIMQMLELLEAHARVHAEILHTKLSKAEITEVVKKRDEAKLKAAREYRATKNLSIGERVEKKEKKEQLSAEEKAIRGLAKQLNLTYDAAKVMFMNMTMKKEKEA